MNEKCYLCPHKCGVARFSSTAQLGWCGAGNCARVFRWGPHFGEEPPITRARGSGCIFFSRCTMKCLYCQNSPWSWNGKGEDKTIDELVEIFKTLAIKDKVENWNLVSPTPYLPFIREANYQLKKEGINLPFVWNSSGYERVEILEEYKEFCDFALFDLRYSNNSTALLASATPNYVERARAAIKWAYEKNKANLIVRILVLPGFHEEAIDNLAFLATEIGRDVQISLMSQYTSAYKAKETPPFDRTITRDEYDAVVEAAADFGLDFGWTQDFAANDPKIALLGENMSENHGIVK